MEKNKPFINRGNLTDEQLYNWLKDILDKISLKADISREINGIEKSITEKKEVLNKVDVFLQTSIHQTDLESTQHYGKGQAYG